MTLQQRFLIELPPEIFSIIASNLPLYITPPTLLSLALANRRLSEIILPILNSTWILRDDRDALKMIQRLLDEPETGKAVRELHILSFCGMSRQSAIYIIRHLEKVIIETAIYPFPWTLFFGKMGLLFFRAISGTLGATSQVLGNVAE